MPAADARPLFASWHRTDSPQQGRSWALRVRPHAQPHAPSPNPIEKCTSSKTTRHLSTVTVLKCHYCHKPAKRTPPTRKPGYGPHVDLHHTASQTHLRAVPACCIVCWRERGLLARRPCGPSMQGLTAGVFVSGGVGARAVLRSSSSGAHLTRSLLRGSQRGRAGPPALHARPKAARACACACALAGHIAPLPCPQLPRLRLSAPRPAAWGAAEPTQPHRRALGGALWPLNISLSVSLDTLPVALWGMSSTSTTSSGTANLRACVRTRARVCVCVCAHTCTCSAWGRTAS